MIYLLTSILLAAAFYGWLKRKALQRYVGLLKQEIAELRGRNQAQQETIIKLANITERAILAAGEASKITKAELFPDRDFGNINATLPPDYGNRSQADYVAPIVANCSNCNVSVRHESHEYPVPCPACKTLIDPVLDNPPEL